MLWNAPGGIHQVILPFAFIHPRAFLVTVHADYPCLLHTVVVHVCLLISSERFFSQRHFYDSPIVIQHIPGQFHIPKAVVPPIQVCLSVIVDKHSRVDIVNILIDNRPL